jgi:hypothetical protein
MRITKTKIALAASAAAVVALGSTAAFAYFTTTGSGSGSAAVGSPSSWDGNVSVVADTAALYPGAASVPVAVTVKNAGGRDQAVNAVHLAITGGLGGTCNADATNPDFTLTDPEFVSPFQLASGASHEFDGSIVMNETGKDQKDCAGSNLTITASVS